MHVVLGSTGGIGHWVVEKLLKKRDDVRVMARDLSKLKHWANKERVEIVEGDALVAEDVRKATSGAESIYHCLNVPYPEWKSKVIPMLSNTIAAAKTNNAKIVFPSNVYVYGHARSKFVREDHPFAAHTKKGKIRIQMERILYDAWKNERVPYTVVRFPDFYGPFVLNPIYASIFKNALGGRPITWYGKLDVPIELSYIEDAGEAFVTAGLDASTAGQTYNVPGVEVTTPRRWLQQVLRIAGSKSRIRAISDWIVSLYGLFNPLAREFREMLYLKEEPLILDGAKFRNKFGRIPGTSYEDGIKRTLEWFREN